MPTTGTLAGTFETFTSAPATGRWEIVPSVTTIRDVTNAVILTIDDDALRGALDTDGSFTCPVPAYDDPTLDPTGVTYTAVISLDGRDPIVVPGIRVYAGQTVDIATALTFEPSPTYAPAVTLLEFLALVADVATKLGLDDVATVATTGQYADLIGRPNLATVATTGAYTDLTGRPTIPTTPGQVGADPAGAAATAQAAAIAAAASDATTKVAAETARATAVEALKADLVGGVIPNSQIPALALTTGQAVANRAAMLALTNVQPGDIVAIAGTADKGTYILTDAGPSTVFASWLLLNAPTDVVQSVNGQNGTVVLGPGDVGADPTGSAATAQAAAIAAATTAINALPAPLPTTTWAATTNVPANKLVLLPTGGLAYSTVARTTRATFDATERATWVFIPGGHVETITATGAGTWVCPAGVTQLTEADLLGPGAGGNGAASASAVTAQVGGTGGSPGERVVHRGIAVTAGTSYAYVVGAGGTGGAGAAAGGAAGTAGGTGGDTTLTIGATTYQALRGQPGAAGAANSTATIGAAFAGQSWAGTGLTPGQGGIAQSTSANGPIPLNGVVGGRAGSPASATLGGQGGIARTSIGSGIIPGTVATGNAPTSSGTAGTTATIPGCGGGGGGGGAPGGAGGNGGNGARGELVLRY